MLCATLTACAWAQPDDAARFDPGVAKLFAHPHAGGAPLLSGTMMEGPVRAYLDVPDVVGAATDPAFEGWTPVLDWRYDLEWIPVSDGQRQSSQLSLGPLTVRKLVDQSTPQLLAKAMDGTPMDDVGLQVTTRVNPDGGAWLLNVKLSHVQITSMRRLGTSRFGPGVEELTLKFDEAIFEYKSYDERNRPVGEWECRIYRR
jgi:type VI protein secretion system component Hcp